MRERETGRGGIIHRISQKMGLMGQRRSSLDGQEGSWTWGQVKNTHGGMLRSSLSPKKGARPSVAWDTAPDHDPYSHRNKSTLELDDIAHAVEMSRPSPPGIEGVRASTDEHLGPSFYSYLEDDVRTGSKRRGRPVAEGLESTGANAGADASRTLDGAEPADGANAGSARHGDGPQSGQTSSEPECHTTTVERAFFGDEVLPLSVESLPSPQDGGDNYSPNNRTFDGQMVMTAK